MHSFKHGECRLGVATASGSSPKRTNPHEPRPRHDNEPTAHQPASSGGVELGAEAEKAVQESDRVEQLRASESREMEARQAQEAEAVVGGTGSSSSGNADAAADSSRRPRGPDLVPRERRTWKSTCPPAASGKCLSIF